MATSPTALKRRFEKMVVDPNYGSTITIIPLSPTSGAFGGYNAGTENPGVSTNIKCVVLNGIRDRKNLQKFGDLREGDLVAYVRENDLPPVTDKYKINYLDDDYDIRVRRPVRLGDTILLIRLFLTRRIKP